MTTQIVSPASKGSESFYLFGVTLLIIASCAFLISLETGKEEKRTLQDYQIDAFVDLNSKELAVFNSLRTSALEINSFHEESGIEAPWPTVEQMQEDALPPFTKDVSWKKSGGYTWARSLRPKGNIDLAAFIGHPKDNHCGSMLLLFTHEHGKKQGNVLDEPKHPPYEIWYHKAKYQPLPDVLTDQILIAAGWKEIRALSGADEVKRVKGVE